MTQVRRSRTLIIARGESSVQTVSVYIAIWFGRLLALLRRTARFVVCSKMQQPKRQWFASTPCRSAQRKPVSSECECAALGERCGRCTRCGWRERNRSKEFSSSLGSCGDGELGMSPTLHGAAMREHVLRAMQSLRRSSVHVSLIAAAMDAAC